MNTVFLPLANKEIQTREGNQSAYHHTARKLREHFEQWFPAEPMILTIFHSAASPSQNFCSFNPGGSSNEHH